MKRWWIICHICSDWWMPIRAWTIFGVPLVTRFYSAYGPFKDKYAAQLEANLRNGDLP